MPQKSGRRAGRRGRVAAPKKRDLRDAHVRELIRQGVEHLEGQRAGPAQRKFRQALGLHEGCADARAYLALTHGLLQQWEKASAEAESVLRTELEHFVALVALARAHYGAGRAVEANHAAVRALRRYYGTGAGRSRSTHDLTLLVDMLTFMGADRRLSQLYRRRVRGRVQSWDPMLLAAFGIAAFNCGHSRDARWAWRQAGLAVPDQARLFTAYLFVNDMVEQGRIPPFRLDYELRARYDENKSPTPGFLKVFALHALWHGNGVDDRQAALDLLIEEDEEWSTALLFTMLRDPALPDELKLQAGTMLMDLGLVPEDDPLEMHVEGQLQSVTIETEQVELDLDAATAAFFGEALEADARGHGATAEAGYRAVLAEVPSFVPALLGLATICESTGRSEEAEELLHDALQVEPFHPLIRLKLTALYVDRERFAEGWDLIRTVRGVELPPGVRSAYYWLYGRLALMLDTVEAAETAFQRGLQEDPDNDELLAGYLAARRAGEETRQRRARSSLRRRQRHEGQPLAPNMTWEEGLERLTLRRLQAMARHIGLQGIWSLRKKELAARIAEVLRTELATLWHTLSPKEQAALRWVTGRGGTVGYEELRRRFGDDAEDSIDWLDLEPMTVPMRLQFHGLVFVGRLEDTEEAVAMVPREARLALKFAGRRTT